MKFSLSAISLALALTASAVPIEEEHTERSAAVSGSGPGSIFQFGSPSNCRQLFWQYGACGLSTYFASKVPSSMSLVALPSGIFDSHGPSDQGNSLCAKVITMTHNGVTRQAVVADENTSSEQSIDMCLDLWQAFGGHDGDGTLIENITWSIAS
jgi:DNA-binding XRE family transcriptional regulator